MSAARRRHLRTVGGWLLGFAVLGVALLLVDHSMKRQNAELASKAAVERLLDAEMAEAVALSQSLRESDFARDAATKLIEDEDVRLGRRVRAAMLIADDNPKAARLLSTYTLKGSAEDVVEIARGLNVPLKESADDFAQIWQSQTDSRETLIRAACMMARHPQGVQQLQREDDLLRLVKLLLAENPLSIQSWSRGVPAAASRLDSAAR